MKCRPSRMDICVFLVSTETKDVWYILLNHVYCQGRRNEKRARGANFVEGHRQNFNYVKIHTRKFRGSVSFFLRQILTHHILIIASAITLGISTSEISSIYSATAGFIFTN